MQGKNLSLFDLLLDEIYPWESMHHKPKILATEILARLIANWLRNPEEEKNHE